MQEICEQNCIECREWEDHFYWNHLDSHRMHFFKFMVGNFTESMSIPKKFANHFNGQISEYIDLKPPSGNIWRVGLNKLPNDIALQSGWKDFVSTHRIEENDLLIFKYCGSSSFEVLIFDGSGCEKASSFFVKKKYSLISEGGEIPVEVTKQKELIELRSLSSSSEGDVKPEITSKSLNDSCKTSKRIHRAGSSHGEKNAGTYAETLVRRKRSRVALRKDAGPSKGVNFNVKKDTPESDEDELEHDQMPCNAPYFSLRSLQLSQLQHKKMSKLALALRPNPTFVICMYPSRVNKNCFLNIPRSFAAAHLPRRCEQIILKLPNQKKKWIASYIFTKHVRGIFRGWKNFVRDNNLQQGDICLFELAKNKRMLTMTVYIY